MNPKLSPQEVRTIAESLTGQKTVGVVERQRRGELEAYKMNVPNGFLLCMEQKGGWFITLFDGDGTASASWSSVPSPKAQIGVRLIDMFIHNNQHSVNPVFEKEYLEIEKDIERKTFSSDIGPIVIHTRRHPLGTEGVIELIRTKVKVRYLWERATSAIDPKNVEQIETLPF